MFRPTPEPGASGRGIDQCGCETALTWTNNPHGLSNKRWTVRLKADILEMMFRKIVSWTLVAMAAGVCPSICAPTAKQSPFSSDRGCCPKCNSSSDEPLAPVEDTAGNSCFCCGVAANPTKSETGSDVHILTLWADIEVDWLAKAVTDLSSIVPDDQKEPPLHLFGHTLPLVI